MVTPRVLLFFLDGVGIGARDQGRNPFFAAHLPVFRSLTGGNIPSLRSGPLESPHGSVRPLKATLGVPGLPQSGTGQTTLLTGINASAQIGKHFGPYPYSTLRPV